MQAKVVTTVQSLQSCYWGSEFIRAKGKGSSWPSGDSINQWKDVDSTSPLSLEGKSPD